MDEEDVKKMFDRLDTIEECVVLRDTNGHSKGCAFVTFCSKQAASLALKVFLLYNVNNIIVIINKRFIQYFTINKMVPGSPTVLKFADTQKDKEMKKIQQMQMGLWNSMLKNCSKKGTDSPPVSSLPNRTTTHQAPSIENKTVNTVCATSVPLIQQIQPYGVPQSITAPIQPTITQKYPTTQPYYLQHITGDLNAIHSHTLASPYHQYHQPSTILSNPSTLLCKFNEMN